jgi:DNA polymerase-4
MRIACVYLPHFYYQIERLKTPGMEGHPVIIGGLPSAESSLAPGERNRVADCSDEAAALGVSPEMSLKEAYRRCPDAVFLPSGGRYESTWENVLYALGAFSSRTEPESPGVAYLDITRALKIFEDERALAKAIILNMAGPFQLKARIGIANSRFIAKQAALCAWDSLIVEPGEEKEFLSLLPLETLPINNKEKDRLRLLGLATLKKIGHLSRKALISQFGATGNVIFELVNGIDDKRPIARHQGNLSLDRKFTGEVPLDTPGELRPIIENMIAELSDELNRLRMTARKISITLWLQNGRSLKKLLDLKRPSADPGHISRVVSGFLESFLLENPVISLCIALPDPALPKNDYGDLFRRKSVFANRLEKIRSYFNVRYGCTPPMKVKGREEHPRLPERRFRFADL